MYSRSSNELVYAVARRRYHRKQKKSPFARTCVSSQMRHVTSFFFVKIISLIRFFIVYVKKKLIIYAGPFASWFNRKPQKHNLSHTKDST